MSISPSFFRAQVLAYSALLDAEVQPKIDAAVLTCCLDAPDPELVDELDVYNLALVYLTAHLLYPAYGEAGATAGPVISRTDGRVSVSFADRGSAFTATGPNASTPYGIQYDELCRSQGSDILVV